MYQILIQAGLAMATAMMAPMVFTLTVMNSAVMVVTVLVHVVVVMIHLVPMNAAYQMVTTHLVLVVMVCPIVVWKTTTVVFVMVIT